MLDILKYASDAKQIEARISEWGKWVRYQCSVVGSISPLAALMRDNVGSSISAAPLISDDEAECIGRAVDQLERAEPIMGEAIKLYFCTRVNNVRDLGLKLKVSKARAAELLHKAMSWLQGYFCAVVKYS